MKLHHMITAYFISVVISNITPFYIGGDILSFWYLQKKGYDRATLVSTFLISTFFFQVALILSSIVILPFVFSWFNDILFNDNPRSITILVLLFLGIIINFIGGIFYWITASWSKFQNVIVKFIRFLLKITFIFTVINEENIVGSLYFGFARTKENFKQCFKNKWFALEILFYRLVFYWISFAPFVAYVLNLLNFKTMDSNWYFYNAVALMIVSSANSISITPGGVGTGDWFLISVYQKILTLDNWKHFVTSGAIHSTAEQIFAFSSQQFFYTTPTILSGLFLLTVWLGEKRNVHYARIRKNIYLNNMVVTHQKIKTIYFKIASIIWIVGIASLITILMLV